MRGMVAGRVGENKTGTYIVVAELAITVRMAANIIQRQQVGLSNTALYQQVRVC